VGALRVFTGGIWSRKWGHLEYGEIIKVKS
jgi:hypothetical protein